jgi:translation initiation factor IF-1
VSTVEGKVVESMPHALFEIELDNGKKLVCHIAGKDRPRLLRVVPGDKVTVEISPNDPGKGRIVKRRR